ncbi:transcription termination factor Rho [Lachnospiraceae bacterium NSJ-143]|nr:transcription termination factor Rho [Lachnospiraceae bacterium NSJ-143]
MQEVSEKNTLVQLRETAKQLNIKGIGSMKKIELIEKINSVLLAESHKNEKLPEKSTVETVIKRAEPEKKASENADTQKKYDNKEKYVGHQEIEDLKEPAVYREPHQLYQPVQNSQREREQREPSENEVVQQGVLEVMADGYGFLRTENYLPGTGDIYISQSQIRRFNVKTGDLVTGYVRASKDNEKFNALLYVKNVNGDTPDKSIKRPNFEDLTPIYPTERLSLETSRDEISGRIIDLMAPIGKGQRGMIVAQPKVGKTTLLKQMANSIVKNHQDINLIVLLIDERPEEVTDIQRSIQGDKVEIVYSTFDEQPEHHKRVAEMVLERGKRLVEQGKDIVILLDSITRLARAYNLTTTPSGRTLSGGLDPAALYMPKKFFGAARNIENGGSLTILATALIETGSKMDDVVFEEFKGTGNMELVLDRKLAERRIFPAIDINKSGTRRDDKLLSKEEMEAVYKVRRLTSPLNVTESTEYLIELMKKTRNNDEFVKAVPMIKN